MNWGKECGGEWGLGVGACNTFRGQTELGGRQKPVYSAYLTKLLKECYCW